MKIYCQYCQSPLAPQRSTRRYCSNSCRQLDYYKRKKEFTLAGYFTVKNETDTVKSFTVKPLNVKDSVKDFTVKSLSVKDNVKEEVPGISDQQLDILAEKVFVKLKGRIEDIIYRKTFSVNNTVSVKDTVKEQPPAMAEEPLFTDIKENTVKEPLTVKEDWHEPEYKPVQSRFIDRIVQHLARKNSAALSRFLYPELYWSGDYLVAVKWVSLRFRCLVENLIEIGRFQYIDETALRDLVSAFHKLESSRQFMSLKEDYPYKDLLPEWRLIVQDRLTNNEGQKVIRMFISPKKRAELIATRFELAKFVPETTFDDLDFSEMK